MGLVQGITEFLPVSSSGHLVIAQELLNWRGPHLEFDVAVHGGTLLAVVLVFWRQIEEVLRAPLGRKGRLILWGTLPTGLLGLLIKGWGEALFSSGPFAAAMLLVTGGLLWGTKARGADLRGPGSTDYRRALLIGLAQGVAVLPGVSRSGATISVALLLGLRRPWAGEFSFLLAVPALLGAMILEAREMLQPSLQWPLMVGALSVAISGFLALKVLLRVIKAGRLYLFAPYCWAVGAGYLVFHFAP